MRFGAIRKDWRHTLNGCEFSSANACRACCFSKCESKSGSDLSPFRLFAGDGSSGHARGVGCVLSAASRLQQSLPRGRAVRGKTFLD